MAKANAVGGLKWVRGEIVASLQRVRMSLEAFAEGGVENGAILSDAVTALSEIRGVLTALQLSGPARLVEEMQHLCEAVAEGAVPSSGESAEALMLALIQLPDYLDKVQGGHPDVPLALLPAINDLRGSRGEGLLSEAELLVPTSVLADTEMPSPEVQKALGSVSGKIRPHFHRYLLQWFKPDTSREGLANLGRLFHQLRRYIKNGIFHELFLVAEAVVEAMLDGSIPSNGDTKALIGHLDRVIKPFAEDTAAWPEGIAQTLLFELLSLVAKFDSSSTYLVTELRHAYGLEGGLKDAAALTYAMGPSREAMSGLIAEARKELLPVKDALDLYARGAREDSGRLAELGPLIRNLASTLAVTAADELVARLRVCADSIDALARTSISVGDSRLMAVAEELLIVESELAELAGTGKGNATQGVEIRALRESALKEARVEMAKAEQSIGSMVDEPGDLRPLQDVPELFHRVGGALRVLGEQDAADVLDAVVGHIRQRYLASGRPPAAGELEQLAHSISGIDLYMDGLSGGQLYRQDLIGDARRALAKLADMAPPQQAQDAAPPATDEGSAWSSGGTEETGVPSETGTGGRIDPEFLEIFLEEAQEEEQAIRDQFARWRRDGENELALTTLRRSFHTLKGSGRLVGAERVGDLACAVENLLNRIIDHTVTATAEIMEFFQDAVALLPELIVAETAGLAFDVREAIARADALAVAGGVTEATGLSESEHSRSGKVIPWPTTGRANDLAETPGSREGVADLDAGQAEAEEAELAQAAELAALADVDEELLDIFRSEAREHLDVLKTFLAVVSQGAAVPGDDVLRSLHTLTGSARMTGVDSAAAATRPLESLFQTYAKQGAGASPESLDLLSRAVDTLQMRLDRLPGGGDEIAALQGIGAQAQAGLAHAASMAGGDEPVAVALSGPASAESYPLGSPAGPIPDLALAEQPPGVGDHASDPGLAEASESTFAPGVVLESETYERAPVEELGAAADASGRSAGIELLEPDLEQVAQLGLAPPEGADAGVPAPPAEPDAAGLDEPHPSAHEPPVPTLSEAEPVEPVLPPSFSAAAAAGLEEPGAEVGTVPVEEVLFEAAESVPAIAASAEVLEEEFDQLPHDTELLALFLEDAREILDKLDQSLKDLQLAPTTSEPLEALQRLLHTLKGSARLSGVSAIGDLSHAFESLLTAISHGHARVDDDTLELAQRTLDTLADQVDAVEQRKPLRRAGYLVQALSLALEDGLSEGSADEPSVAVMVPTSTPVPEQPSAPAPLGTPKRAVSIPSAIARTRAPAAEAAAPHIRVRADLLNRLVNNAGEISIYRSRLSQQSGQVGFRLAELDQTVSRLREQLRLLEIETEAQIIHRFERDSEASPQDREKFDPLELDRFSTLQQRSRSLAETVNDLVSLRTILSDLHREFDTLLLQQGRIADDLQDGLLRTRMVPFAQVVPRLHRVVRQTAQQLGKKARLEVFGPEVELDRSIQERIVAPLEHLLRNAVAHGIELPAQRAACDKDASGVIGLAISREGNDAVITVRDDGAGLDLDAIRARAVERGLLAEGVDAGKDAIMQLILESGFSTVREVTQIAGRGVGLDVVNAEIKQLSGTFTLDTEVGHGTTFTIRLPLTLAIIEALLVQVGDEVYAVPHATIEGAARISRGDLLENYRGTAKDFSYAGQDFRVIYLGSMLRSGVVPDLGERRWLPVLLARAGDQRIAFQVDSLIGSQRIVVKPLGPALSSIRWLSGGTILPDGRVAMILDVLGLIRSGLVHDYRPPMQSDASTGGGRTCIMVVDDSLTVRRVTSRMLRRQDMDVITARDGVDALALLEDRLPDLILLDVEMPRMDGYELTRHIRRSPRLKEIPLIMITSRTGEKHRRYAQELGVDRYLGKPYQEAELLDEISSVLVESAS